MLLDQASAVAQASDPFSAGQMGMNNAVDENGNPISNPEENGQVPPQNTPDQTTVDLGIT
jgi:hypothetical protein